MNKLSFLVIVLLSTFISCNAQRTQERTITPFNKIKISGAIGVTYTNSDSLNLVVKGKENEVDNIETKVENSTLFISSKGNFRGPIHVYVKNSQLQNIELTGATSLKTTNQIKSDSLAIKISGAANVAVKVQAQKINSDLDGASNLTLEGTTDDFNANLSGASVLKGYSLVAKNAVIVTSGAASAKVNVTEKLNATATSASNIKIQGDPKDVTAESTTAASITRIKELSKKEERTNGDTTSYNWKSKKILVINNEDTTYHYSSKGNVDDFKHWRGFSMGINGFVSPSGGVTIPAPYQYMDLDYRRSLNFQFNIVERQIDIVKNNFKLVTGFGFDYHLYELANKTTLNADSSFTWGVIDSTNQYSYKKNKLRCTYIQVPLLLEFNTSNDPDKTFHVAFGVIGQFLISSRTKQVLEEGKDKITNVRKDGYNMTPFAAKAHVNLGYRNWTFFGEYSLTELFQSGKGPELYPFTAGIRVVPFG